MDYSVGIAMRFGLRLTTVPNPGTRTTCWNDFSNEHADRSSQVSGEGWNMLEQLSYKVVVSR